MKNNLNKKTKKPISIYIHIPFCKSRCGYCDFLTFACGSNYYEPYKNALIKEILEHDQLHNYNIISIFIGGGTPTVLPPSFIAEILLALGTYNIVNNAEITVEANPGTLSLQMLRMLKNYGVTRLSIGLQAWQNNILKKIERGHKLSDFLINYNHARKIGFNNINVDLIFSWPNIIGNKVSSTLFSEKSLYNKNSPIEVNQKISFKDWHTTLKNVANLNPNHISLYSLIIEENTPFSKAYEDGRLILQTEELDRRMYHHAIKYLSKKGYNHYEISNFSKQGKECKHNLVYWQRGEYIAFGLGAHSFFNEQRTRNITSLSRYIQVLNAKNYTRQKITKEVVQITKKDAMEEFMYLGLRCIDGISIEQFEKTFNKNISKIFGISISSNIEKGLLQKDNDKISLTSKGLDISNVVMSDFLL